MLHYEYITGNPLTGRKAWIVRHINGDKYGDPFDWSCLVIRAHYFSRVAVIECMTGEGFRQGYIGQIRWLLRSMGFNNATAMRRGKWKHYRVI